MQRAQGFAQQGGEVVWTAGVPSSNLVQASFPFAVITVFVSGTTELALIFSDNQQFPTPMANPFLANASGYWFFYAANGRYDVMIESPELDVPWTIGDILLNDGGGGGDVAQTPWLSNIDGGGFNLSNVGFIDVTGGYLVNGVPLANPNLWIPVPNSSSIYHQGFVGVINQNPAFALDVQGGVNCTDNFYINGVAISGGSGGGGPWVVLGASQINYAGNVGISNTNPQYALDVHGSINVSTGNNFFINGVAVGSTGQNPWTILAGNRITYAGQVGIGANPPAYPLDVLGDVNITGAYRVNGVAIGGGGGQWLPGSNGAIFYNGGNVGIGTQTPTVALQVPGTVAAGQFAMTGNPTSPVINSNGAFVGAGVNVGSFGLAAATVTVSGQGQPANTPILSVNGDILCSFSIDCTGQVIGAAFGLNGTEATPPNAGGFVINGNGAFVGSGVDVTGQAPVSGPSGGIRCIDLQANSVSVLGPIEGIQTAGEEGALLALGAVVSADASSATTGGPAVTGGYYVQPLNQAKILVINSLGQFVGPGITVGAQGIQATYIQVGNNTNTTALSVEGDIQCSFSIEATGQIIGNAYAIQSTGHFGGSGTYTDGTGGSIVVEQGLVISFVNGSGSGGGGGNLNVASLTATGQVSGGSGSFGSITTGGGSASFGSVSVGGNGSFGSLNVGSGGISTPGNIVCNDVNSVSTAATQFIGAGLGYQVGGTTVIDSGRNVSAATVTASNFNVAGGSPGIPATVSWYGASTSGGPANVLHQLVFEQGILVAFT